MASRLELISAGGRVGMGRRTLKIIRSHQLILNIRRYSYVDRGYYAKQIEHILNFFSREQVYFLKYEDFLKEQESTLNTVFAFLGISVENIKFQSKKVLQIPYERTMRKDEWNILIDLFSADIDEVERLLEWNCKDWRTYNHNEVSVQFSDENLD